MAIGKIIKEGGRLISGIGIPPRGSLEIRTGLFDPRYDSRVNEKERVENLVRRIFLSDNPAIDEVPLSYFEGRPYVTSMADRSFAGGVLTGINDVPIAPVPLQGGQGYMFRNPGQVWASAPGITRRMHRGALAGGEDTAAFFPFRMGPTGGDYAEKTGRTMMAYNAAAMNKRQKRDLNRAIKKEFSAWPGIDSEKANDFLASLNGPRRSRFLKVIDSRRNDGGLSLGEARVSVVDPEQLNATDFRLMNAGEIDATSPLIEDSGHITYKTGLPGEGIGRLRDAEKISPFDLDPASGTGPIRAADPLNPTPEEMYTLRQQPEARGVITPEILKRLQDRGVDVGALAGAGILGGALAPEEAEAGVLGKVGDLVRMGFPEGTAKKIASGELPMDEASRMQRADEQGYLTDLYHGSNADITEMKPSSGGRFGGGVYATNDPRRAVGGRGKGASVVYPLKVREPDLSYGGGAISVIDDPANIRSRFAAFDPDNIGKNALLGGLGGAAVLGGALSPEEAEAAFAGRLAKNADEFMLSVAGKMEDAGMSPDDIWQKTGWGRGADGKWRFEIDDSQSSYQPDIYDMPLSESYQHPELYRAYPDVSELPLDKYMEDSLPYKQVPHGSYSPSDDVITIRDEFGSKRGRSVLAHESQHAIQERENFGRGTNPEYLGQKKAKAEFQWKDLQDEQARYAREMDAAQKSGDDAAYRDAKLGFDAAVERKAALWDDINMDPYEAYRATAGEVEARTVQERLDWSPEMRREIPPWETYQRVKERGAADPRLLGALATGALGAALWPLNPLEKLGEYEDMAKQGLAALWDFGTTGDLAKAAETAQRDPWEQGALIGEGIKGESPSAATGALGEAGKWLWRLGGLY